MHARLFHDLFSVCPFNSNKSTSECRYMYLSFLLQFYTLIDNYLLLSESCGVVNFVPCVCSKSQITHLPLKSIDRDIEIHVYQLNTVRLFIFLPTHHHNCELIAPFPLFCRTNQSYLTFFSKCYCVGTTTIT